LTESVEVVLLGGVVKTNAAAVHHVESVSSDCRARTVFVLIGQRSEKLVRIEGIVVVVVIIIVASRRCGSLGLSFLVIVVVVLLKQFIEVILFLFIPVVFIRGKELVVVVIVVVVIVVVVTVVILVVIVFPILVDGGQPIEGEPERVSQLVVEVPKLSGRPPGGIFSTVVLENAIASENFRYSNETIFCLLESRSIIS